MENCVEGIDGILVKGYVVFKDNDHEVLTYPKAMASGIRIVGDEKKFGTAGGSQNGNAGHSPGHVNESGPSGQEPIQSLGVSFHHGRFVMNLRKAARSAPK